MQKKISIALMIALITGAVIYFYINNVMRVPDSSSYMRGSQLAVTQGCVGCHEQINQDVIMNPASLRGVIPNFNSGASTDLFWVENKNEFYEWVKEGVSGRIKKERESFDASHAPAAISMPAYKNTLSAAQIDDLYVYFTGKNNGIKIPPDTDVSRGAENALRYGCFACHGVYGINGISNPGSFKGYIPPWEGEDFNALVKNDDELREWIRTGRISRLSWNPVARYFLETQKIKMPAYQDVMTDQELSEIMAYIRWLPSRNTSESKKKSFLTDKTASPDGDKLFNRSGCTTCHNPSSGEGFSDRYGTELPPRERLANRLRSYASIIDEREKNGRHDKNALCNYYQDFSEEYKNIHRVILEGTKEKKLPDQQTTTQTPMPAWHERANRSDNASELQEIDSIINALLRDSLMVTDEQMRGWKRNAENCIRRREKPMMLDDDSSRRQKILARIEMLDTKNHAFDNLPSVGFFSLEANLYDVISLYADSDIDIWVLRQFQEKSLPADQRQMIKEKSFPTDIRYFIAIDKTDVIYRAFYFVSARNSVQKKSDANQEFVFQDARMQDCFSCHVSGTRVLRPHKQEKIDLLTRDDWALIEKFNKRILGYGATATNWPNSQKRPDPHQQKSLSHEACSDCHKTGSVRSPLLRFHQMPMARILQAHKNSDGYYTAMPDAHGQLSAMPPLYPASQKLKDGVQAWVDEPASGL